MKHTKGNKYKSENLLIIDIETDRALYFHQILKKLNQYAEMYEALNHTKRVLDVIKDKSGIAVKVLSKDIDKLLKSIES